MTDPKIEPTAVAPSKSNCSVSIFVKKMPTKTPVIGVECCIQSSGKDKVYSIPNTSGKYGGTSKVVSYGSYRVLIHLKNHQAVDHAGTPLATGRTPYEYVAFEGPFTSKTKTINAEIQQTEPNVYVKVIEKDKSGTKSPVIGAKVTVNEFSEFTPTSGNVLLEGVVRGKSYTVTVTRNGYGAPGTVVVGAVTAKLDLSTTTSLDDMTFEIEMVSLWGKVKSGNISVEGKLFPQWYKDNFYPPAQPQFHPTIKINESRQLAFPPMTKPEGFTGFFNNLKKWFGRDLSIEEFVATFMIVTNEQGGTYDTQPEIGRLDYFIYLNKTRAGNRLAGDLLKDRGALTDLKQIADWNGPSFPKPKIGKGVKIEDWEKEMQKQYPSLTYALLKECDFYKFRGRGHLQETGHKNYLENMDSVFKASESKSCESLTCDELDKAFEKLDTVAYPVTKKHLDLLRDELDEANAQIWKPFGKALSGNDDYGELFRYRCEALYAKLTAAAAAGKLTLS